MSHRCIWLEKLKANHPNQPTISKATIPTTAMATHALVPLPIPIPFHVRGPRPAALQRAPLYINGVRHIVIQDDPRIRAVVVAMSAGGVPTATTPRAVAALPFPGIDKVKALLSWTKLRQRIQNLEDTVERQRKEIAEYRMRQSKCKKTAKEDAAAKDKKAVDEYYAKYRRVQEAKTPSADLKAVVTALFAWADGAEV